MRPPPDFAAAVLMVRPAAFGWNPETAATNGFQRPIDGEAARAALGEFDRAAQRLAAAGVEVTIWEDTPTPAKPDAIFPNNWVSTHPGGRVVLYPMLTPSRRAEVRPELVDGLGRDFAITEVIDLRAAAGGRCLEGTGSLVIDAAAGTVYAAWSPRTDPGLTAEWAALFGLEVVGVDARDPAGAPIYHTNVILSLGAGFSVCALDRIADDGARARLAERLAARGELLALGDAQVEAFAGNLLQLRDRAGGPALALSTTALAALTPADRRLLERHSALVPLEIPTIEVAGGGSARCMLAENFLERR
ncbi:MAG: arginine deiminase-related protein [Nannocystaceae bacterium]